MKVTCTQRELSRGIAVALRAVSTRSTLPIMANVLLVAEGDTLRISGTNLQIRIDCAIPCQVKDGGAITVPARMFGEIISKLNGSVTLEVNHKTKQVAIQCGNYAAKINGLDAEDFPALPTDKEASVASIGASVLTQMISQTTFAASTDISRQTLLGVEIKLDGNRIAMAATDGYRLATRAGGLVESVVEAQSVIVPATSLAEVSNALAAVDGESPVTIKTYEARNRISFHAQGVDISTQLIDANFPDYRAIIPKSDTTKVTVETKALLRSLQVARILTKQDKDGTERAELKVDPKAGQLAISVTNAEVGNSGDVLEVKAIGDPVTITLSIGFMLDVLSRVDDESVVLGMTLSTRPLTMRLVGTGGDDFLQVIMPISTKGDRS